MKKHIITAILAVLSSSSYSLLAVADTADVYQRGNYNTVTVTQSGLLDSTAAIDQNGNGIAEITQVSVNGSSANAVEVVQDGVTTGTGNKATVTQNAGGNTVRLYQSSLTQPNLTQPFASVGTGSNTGGIAFGNTAEVTQNGTDNILASIAQIGNNNTAKLLQDGGNSAGILQNGNGNNATVTQTEIDGVIGSNNTGDTAIVTQSGANGNAIVKQLGKTTANSATVIQDTASSGVTASILQSGTFNIAKTTQTNAFNIANITQGNSYNLATVTQDGVGLGVNYSAGGNEINITQDGLSIANGSDTATATQHGFEANQINIEQHRGDGSAVNVTQEGAGNIATVVQNL